MIDVLLAWLAADFISGIVHWWEDRAIIGASRSDFINSVREDNERHHKFPSYFLRLTYWENINTTAPIAWSLAIMLIIVGAPTFMIHLAIFLGFGNLIHRFAHEPPAKIPRWVRGFQSIGLFISPDHHNGHHFSGRALVSRQDSTIRYCVMTNWLNPILDRIGFFNALESLFKRGSNGKSS